MLTFENVLEVFADYLQEDTSLEIVLTKRGYTVMCWDNALADWSNVHCGGDGSEPAGKCPPVAALECSLKV